MKLILFVLVMWITVKVVLRIKYRKLEKEILKTLEYAGWDVVTYFDENVRVKSRQALEKYDDIKFFKENEGKFEQAEMILMKKQQVSHTLKNFLDNNDYKKRVTYRRIVKNINALLKNAEAYRICVDYYSAAGNHLGQKEICVTQYKINTLKADPSILMGKGEYNKFLKEQQKDALNKKHREYYEKVNKVIDYANQYKDSIVIRGQQEKIDDLMAQLFDRTVNSIKKIKSTDSEEWDIIEKFILSINEQIEKIVSENQKILEYYDSEDFKKIKDTCEALMSSQREFNDYINEKIQSISKLFGTRVLRNETVSDDEQNYIRPYKKTISPFNAEVSSTVFASAENNPLVYVVKNFYPNKEMYPEQIQKLQLLVEELETLKEAKQIIDNYKQDYQQYIENVPDYVMSNDEAGFYSRLGFAYIDESMLTVEYKFSYTSGGGLAQRSFTVPMTEDTIAELITMLQSKLTAGAFAKEQRALMTRKLRDAIKIRDNYTCCICGNSVAAEPNLLLEIDHIIPIAKGGTTEENNLQTLCWKCNRSKGSKII